MGTHMKTTIDIADALAEEAKQVAAAEGSTLRSLVEEGLRRVLDERGAGLQFRLRKASFKGKGLRPDVRDGSWERIRDISYEGRGG
ncbi:MAG: type II toxin-antitoxin system VapB family antitoxin [Thermoanaerobaculia bacterium]